MERFGWTMETLCLAAWDPGAVQRAVDALRSGQLIAFPTDTVYGVGAHALLPEAVQGLFAVKERPASQAIPVLLSEAAMLDQVCTGIPPLAWHLAERFWPGALSLVLRRSPAVPDAVTAGGETVAVRVPDHTLVCALIRELDAPLAATSANRHGQPAPVTAAGVQAALGGRIPLIVDGGPCPGGLASTVLDLTVSPPAILRPGPVTAEQLSAVVPLRG